MMSANEMIPIASGALQVQGLLDLVAVFVGVIAIYSLIRLNKKLGGKLSSAVNFFNLGMAANVLAIFWSTFWSHMYTIAGVTFDIHHLLMSVGMILFIISTRKLSGLVTS